MGWLGQCPGSLLCPQKTPHLRVSHLWQAATGLQLRVGRRPLLDLDHPQWVLGCLPAAAADGCAATEAAPACAE